MPRKNPETKFKEKVIEDLKSIQCWFLKVQLLATRGIPDILMCRKGFFIAIELKVDAELEELQEYNLNQIKQNGGRSYVATPKNWKKIYR